MERVTTYMYTGRSWGGSACGRDRKRRVMHKETKCACFAVGVVLMCSCVGVWRRERLLSVCGGTRGGGWATRGTGWLQIKSEVSIFEGL